MRRQKPPRKSTSHQLDLFKEFNEESETSHDIPYTGEKKLKRTFKQKADYPLTLEIRQPDGHYRKASPDEIIYAARKEMNARYTQGTAITSPQKTREFLKLQMGHLEHEIFAVLWLDNRHRVIAFEELFRGTIDGASVHPREIAKAALAHNAAACILSHNHPSGETEPSRADQAITEKIRKALDLIDIRTLDHLVVGEGICSLAERGLM